MTNLSETFRRLADGARRDREKGAITLVETLIAISIGAAALFAWAQFQAVNMESDNARAAGRNIAAYSRATATWLAESPPATAGAYGIANLQDCNDPAGVRFLPCIYDADTVIGLATDAGGDPVTFGDLQIAVTLPAAGPRADIDLGVFRQGRDRNGDGLPDSRPDLASIAVRHARENTAPGVFGFFELALAREDPTGLIYDPNDAAFDQAAIDNLARVTATAGAHLAAAPFLRTDGGNEMQAGIGFDNGAEILMTANRLEVQSPGGVDFDTDVTVNNLAADGVQSDTVDVTSTLTVTPPGGVLGAGFDRLDQSADIVRIDGDVVRLSARVTDNEAAIRTNAADIATNAADIADNAADIADNETDIRTNTAAIAVNAADIATNAADITGNAADIAANLATLGNHRGLIDANTGGIATTSADIEQNTVNIRNFINRPTWRPSVCGQTRAEAIARAGGLATNACVLISSCHGRCGTEQVTRRTVYYQERNLKTLNCDSHSEQIITSCCLISNGNCDGWCEHGAGFC